jgi:hypothetical protein
MSEAQEVNFEADRKPIKRAKKGRTPPRRASFHKPEKPKEAFPGLTRTECASTCSAAACAISGKPYCAHPTKGGLQSDDAGNLAASGRLQAARDQIDVRVDPDRFK